MPHAADLSVLCKIHCKMAFKLQQTKDEESVIAVRQDGASWRSQVILPSGFPEWIMFTWRAFPALEETIGDLGRRESNLRTQ